MQTMLPGSTFRTARGSYLLQLFRIRIIVIGVINIIRLKTRISASYYNPLLLTSMGLLFLFFKRANFGALSPFGAGKWRKRCSIVLPKDRKVII